MNPPKNGWANASRPCKRQQKLLRSTRVKEKKRKKRGSTQSGGFSMDHLHSIFSSACSHSGCKVYIRHAVHFLCPVLAGRSRFLQHSFLVFFFFSFSELTSNAPWIGGDRRTCLVVWQKYFTLLLSLTVDGWPGFMLAWDTLIRGSRPFMMSQGALTPLPSLSQNSFFEEAAKFPLTINGVRLLIFSAMQC